MRFLPLFLLSIICALGDIPLKLDSSLHIETLENGFTYYIKTPINPSENDYFLFEVAVGSSDELEHERGVAHFCEHMAFNGSKSLKREEFLQRLLDIGVTFGAHLNAHTDLEYTTFELQSTSSIKNLRIALETLRMIASELSFEKRWVESEKEVILQERLFLESKKDSLKEAREKIYYQGSPYQDREPIGDKRIVKNATPELLRDFYSRAYQPKFMRLVVVSSQPKKLIKEEIIKNFAPLVNNDFVKPSKEIPFIKSTDIFYTTTEDINVHFEEQKEAIASEEALKNMLLNQLFSMIIDEIYDKKRSSIRVKYFDINLHNKKILHTFNIQSNTQKMALEDFFGVLKFIDNGIDEATFQIAKKRLLKEAFTIYQKENFLSAKEEIEELAFNLSFQITPQSATEQFNLNVKIINNLTVSDFNNFAKKIINLQGKIYEIPVNLSLKQREIEEIYNRASSYAFVEENAEKIKILEAIPEAKDIVSIRFEPHLKVNEIELENGIKVFFRPFKAPDKEITILAVKRGGYSTLSRPQVAKIAVDISNRTGIGKISFRELQKISNELLFIRNIDDLTASYYLKSDREHLRELFELIHLDSRGHEIDNFTFKEFIQEQKKEANENEKNPFYLYSKRLNARYYQNNQRTNVLLSDQYDSLKLQDIQKAFDETFRNIGSFMFFITGDISLQELKPLLQHYIATLPPSNRSESFIDDGVRGVDGFHVMKSHLNALNRDEVAIFLKNDNTTFTQKSVEAFHATLHILKILLNEKVRQNSAKSYAISVEGELLKDPYPHSFVKISFVSDPREGEEIAYFIKRTLEDFSQISIDEIYLSNYKKIALNQAQKRFANADFLLSSMINHYVFNYEAINEAEQIAIIKNLNQEDIRSSIIEHFLNGNFFVSILHGTNVKER